MTDRKRAGRVVVVGTLVSLSLVVLGGGCAGNKKDDDIARLTGERDALREAIERDRAAINALANVEPEPAPPITNRPVSGIDDGDFGPGTTTRREHGDLIVEVAGDVLFDSGSIVLKASAKRTLDQVARRINAEYSGNVIRVEGYTDTDPIKKQKDKYKDNEELSAQRALAVERYLVGRGVASSQIYAAAFGPANPKGSKKASRRVEIVILNAR
jgi:chemotaxis protein MotB